MTKVDSNHCRIVRDTLSGKRAADEQTFASLAILGERLEQLKKFNEIFGSVGFSPVIEKLIEQKSAVAVG
jgi:hypothetical protein